MKARVLFTNLAVFAGCGFLLLFKEQRWTEMARDWFPQALAIAAYKQMGWFAPVTHPYTLENKWIVWDRLLLDTFHVQSLIEAGGVLLPSLLELCYTLVYTLPPITVAILYATGRRKAIDAFLTIYLLGLFLSYAQFPFWPSEPPRVVFPGDNQPALSTALREFNLWLVGTHGIHTSVFPSAHVSGVFAAACAVAYLLPGRRRLALTYFVYATLVAVATVYGRYHYAVDALGGFVIGIAALPLGKWLLKLSCEGETALTRETEYRSA
jgi:membrane-associated phospholipid phosphatase